jgi:hypothetical protein
MTSPIPVYHAINGQLVRKGRSAVTPSSKGMVFGMRNTCAVSGTDGDAGATATNFQAIHSQYMNTSSNAMIARTFDGNFPTDWSQTNGKQYTDIGISVLQSQKADPVQVAAGQWDSQIASLAASVPLGSGLSYYHEPENDMAGTTWVPAFQRFYDVVKATNPNVWVAAIHMSFQWGTGHSSTANMDDWNLHGKVDLLCTDTYFMGYQSGYTTIANKADHMRWHNWAYPQGKPLGIGEFGIVNTLEDKQADGTFKKSFPYTDSQHSTLLGNSIDWCHQNGYRMISLWHSYHGVTNTDAGGNVTQWSDFSFTPTVSDPTAHPLTLATWNSKIQNYGQTSPDPTS